MLCNKFAFSKSHTYLNPVDFTRSLVARCLLDVVTFRFFTLVTSIYYIRNVWKCFIAVLTGIFLLYY